MTIDELRELIATLRQTDNDLHHVEAKRAEQDVPRRLWETSSAFSNVAGGGVIILGLDESREFEVVGVADSKKIQQDLASRCSETEPPVRAHIEPHVVDGKTLVVAEVPEIGTDQKPCFYPPAGLTNGAFTRVADGDRKLSSYEVQMLLASRGQPREDERPVPEARVGDLDPELTAGLLERLRTPARGRFRSLDDETALMTVKALVPHGDRLVPSLAGLLALGLYPQQFFASLNVVFTVFPTTRIGEPGPRGERLLDSGRFEGPIPRILRPVLDAVQRNMKRRAIVRGLFREDLWEYPEEAVREALVNALGHRDLSELSRGTSVHVQMFPDRLAVVNPGGLFGPITVDQLGLVGISSRRNQTLMMLLEDVVVPEERRVACENRGTGIGSILATLRQAGMGPPQFENYISTFRATFPNHTLLDEETLRWLARVGGLEMTDSQRMGLALARRGDLLTNDSYRRFTNVDSRVATRELRDLVRQGILEQIGSHRWTTYRIVPEPPEQPTRLVGSLPLSGLVQRHGRSSRTRADRRPAILALLSEYGELSRAEIASRLGIGDSTVRRWLGLLRRDGQIVLTTQVVGSTDARYRLVGSTSSDPGT
jgi:ATP-dependent DNA helicase RecG